MKILDFLCECKKCGTVNSVPLEVKDDMAVHNKSQFVFTCAECIYDNDVLVHLTVRAREKILN